jgi:putative transposase
MPYRGFPSKLHHDVPHWIEAGALFHIRIAVDREKEQSPLTAAPLARTLLDSARFYEIKQRWRITLFLLMPDHLHALLSFPSDESIRGTLAIGNILDA